MATFSWWIVSGVDIASHLSATVSVFFSFLIVEKTGIASFESIQDAAKTIIRALGYSALINFLGTSTYYAMEFWSEEIRNLYRKRKQQTKNKNHEA